MNSKKVIINKHDKIITISNNLTLSQREYYDCLLKNAQKELNKDSNISNFKIPVTKLTNLLSLEDNYKYLIDDLNQLMKTTIELKNFKNSELSSINSFMLVSSIEFIDNTITYELPSKMIDIILKQEIFNPINLTISKNIKSTHTLRLYEILENYKNSPKIPKISIIELKELIGIDNKKYKIFSNLKAKVINKAVNDINDNENIEFFIDYELQKTSRSYSHIQFKIKYKNIKNQKKKLESININKEIENFTNRVKKDYSGKLFCKPYYLGLKKYSKDTVLYINSSNKNIINKNSGSIIDNPQEIKTIFEKLYYNKNLLGDIKITIFDYIGRKIIIKSKTKNALGFDEQMPIECLIEDFIEVSKDKYQMVTKRLDNGTKGSSFPTNSKLLIDKILRQLI